MRSEFFRKFALEIKCPNCKKTIKIRAADIASGKKMTCSQCKSCIELKDKNQGLKKADQSFREMEDALKKLNKTIKINLKF
jgi:transcription initiation factor IIE alpha subunit